MKKIITTARVMLRSMQICTWTSVCALTPYIIPSWDRYKHLGLYFGLLMLCLFSASLATATTHEITLSHRLNACIPMFVQSFHPKRFAAFVRSPTFQQKSLVMNRRKTIQNVLNAQKLFASHKVTDCHCNAIFQKSLLCDNVSKTQYRIATSRRVSTEFFT